MFKVFANQTVSRATLRNEDLIEDWTGVLEAVQYAGLLAIKEEYQSVYAALENGAVYIPDELAEDASFLVNEALWDAMQDIAPKDCFFGAHEGDGSLFGFWSY